MSLPLLVLAVALVCCLVLVAVVVAFASRYPKASALGLYTLSRRGL
jgi:amino acid transporter